MTLVFKTEGIFNFNRSKKNFCFSDNLITHFTIIFICLLL